MTCSCPKCKAAIECDPTVIQPEGSFSKCSECRTDIVIRKESFAKRALYNEDAITCSECGNPAGSSIYCQDCHAIYPDFLVIETTSTAKKLLGKILASLKPKKSGPAHPTAESYTPSSSKDVKVKALKLPGQPAQLAVVLVAILVFAAVGGYYWYQDKKATKYTQSYVRALVCLKLSKDFDIKISDRIVAEWKTGTSSSVTPAEQKSSAAAKSDVDSLMKQIEKVPEKFTSSNVALKGLYDTYSNLHTTVISPTGSADVYSSTVKKIDADFKTKGRELKSGLPEKIATQVRESSKKFKALEDL